MPDLNDCCMNCGHTYGAHYGQSCPDGLGSLFLEGNVRLNPDTGLRRPATEKPLTATEVVERQNSHQDGPLVRSFESGATRSSDAGRYDPEGFLSPLAIEQYCMYMQKNQVQPDGSIRSSDNWQKGIPLDAYMKGLLRHNLHLWCRHRGHPVQDPKAGADKIEDLCAIIFNAQGMLHELLKAKGGAK